MNNDVEAIIAEIQAAVLFVKRLGVDTQSDFQRHHPKRYGGIDENPSNAVSYNLESFYRKCWVHKSSLTKRST